jgi:hypothetical protein
MEGNRKKTDAVGTNSNHFPNPRADQNPLLSESANLPSPSPKNQGIKGPGTFQ